MVSARIEAVLPEWEGFTHAVQARRPADGARWHSQAGPEALGKIRTLLSGY